MSDRTENSRINVFINNAEAQKAMQDLNKEYAKMRDNQKKMEIGSKEWIAAQKDMNVVTAKMVEFRKNVDITTLSIKQLETHSRTLKGMRANVIPGTQSFKELDNQIHKASKRLQELKGNASGGILDPPSAQTLTRAAR